MYINFEEMRKGAERERQERIKHNKAIYDAQKKREEAEQEVWRNLMKKAGASVVEEATKRRTIEMEKEKAAAIKAVEDKYDAVSLVKSDHAKKLDDAYRNLLGALPGPEDD